MPKRESSSIVRRNVIAPALAIATLVAACGVARAADDGHEGCMEHKLRALPAAASTVAGFDEATGRDLRNFPPSPVADFRHMRLDITIEDMNTPRFSARQDLSLRALATPVTELTLNAVAMNITSVQASRGSATFTHDGEFLRVTLDPALPPGEELILTTTYTVNEPPMGLYWTPESPAWPGRPAQLHTQGQPESNRYWFPIHDFPNDRLTTELLVTVPAGFIVSSNGRLIEQRKSIREMPSSTPGSIPDLRPFETFHWLQDKDHVPYLVTLVVGKFDIVDVTDNPALPMPVYVPRGRAADVPGTYGRTAQMVRLFERRLSEPYPWDRYAQLVVHNFLAGGMENTSATTMYDTALIAKDDLEDNDLDSLIAHELAHQWFGDLVTTNSWEHIWLNEGFATYLQAIWFEERDGRDGYEAEVLRTFGSVIGADTAAAPAAVGMASKVYSNPWETFRRAANPYSKGASILHMLRTKLGDQVFFDSIAEYIDLHKHATVETPDLRKVLEARSGESLEQFFYQWTTRPGIPRLNVSLAWDDASSSLSVSIDQTQLIDGDNPAFEFILPLFIATDQAGASLIESIEVRGRSATRLIPLAARPRFVAIDPRRSVLAEVSLERSLDEDHADLIAQLSEAPTLFARVQAAQILGSTDRTPLTTDTLRRLASDTRAHHALRVEAVRSLARRGDSADIRALVTTSIDRWEVRQAIVEALASIAQREEIKASPQAMTSIGERLAWVASNDESVKARAAAIRAIGTLGLIEQSRAVARALTQDSQHDQIRQAAIVATADLAGSRAASLIIPFTHDGTISRTRPIAIESLARVASQDREAALAAISAQVRDRDLRTRRAAWNALATVGTQADTEVVALFDQLINESRAPELTQELQTLRARLTSK